ncbi:hypothetical protein [Shigella sp. FC6481]|nr:hypothetical protein [Shigella sp. FC6481]MDZ9811611.1 hypothetical protein [Escherichia coli]
MLRNKARRLDYKIMR